MKAVVSRAPKIVNTEYTITIRKKLRSESARPGLLAAVIAWLN